MRMTLLVAALAVGCGNDNSSNSHDLAVATNQDLSANTPTDMSMSNIPDGYINITDGGAPGTNCNSACDCMPGLGCFGGQCRMGNRPIYCCQATDCPAGNVCQNMSGMYGRCGGGAPPDLAAFDYCHLIKCTTMGECSRANCTMCVAGATGMECSK